MMKKYIQLFHSLPEKLRFIVSGGINTAVGYTLFLILYFALSPALNYQVILAVSFVMSTFVAFINLKLLVFRTKGNILSEFSKAFLSYIFIYLLNAALLYVFVEFLGMIPYVAQALCISINAVVSYCVHKYFSFRPRPSS